MHGVIVLEVKRTLVVVCIYSNPYKQIINILNLNIHCSETVLPTWGGGINLRAHEMINRIKKKHVSERQNTTFYLNDWIILRLPCSKNSSNTVIHE